MAINKYLKLDKNILLEWTYNDDNIIGEQYKVFTNLQNDNRFFTSDSSTSNNISENQLFNIDPISRKYAKVDTTTYNFLKVQNYSSSPISYDKIRIKLSQNNTIDDGTYKGFLIQLYTYDYYNDVAYELSNYFFDNEDSDRQHEIKYGVPQYYDEQVWIKYVDLEIPSVRVLSSQRTTNLNQSNSAIPDTINYNLTKGIGLSESSPIFIKFTYITNTETVFGKKYYYTDDWYNTSISQSVEYETLSTSIEESDIGDFFIIKGLYNGSNENMDDFIADLRSKGKSIRIEYDVTLYEENIRQRTQTFTVTENFAQEVLYRPVITFSNTTASIDVLMRVIDLVDNSQIERTTSLGMTTNIFKYGTKLMRLDVSNIYSPTIYNSHPTEVSNKQTINSKFLPDLSVSKVNYPILVDKYKLMVGSSKSIDGYKGNGLLEIMITPFDNIVKFLFGKLDTNNNISPYDLSDIMYNSKLVLSFKSEEEFLEKDIFYESDQTMYSKGQVIFKVSEQDVNTLKTISKKNTNFYITLNGEFSKTKTLLYSGKFRIYEDVKFLDTNVSSSSNDQNIDFGSDLGSDLGNESSLLSKYKPKNGPEIYDVTGGGNGASADYADGFLAGYNDGVSGNFNGIKVNDNYDNGYENGYNKGQSDTQSQETTTSIKYFVLFVKHDYNQVSFNSNLEQIIGDWSKVKTMYNFTYIIENITESEKDEILKLEGISSEGGIDKAYEILN